MRKLKCALSICLLILCGCSTNDWSINRLDKSANPTFKDFCSNLNKNIEKNSDGYYDLRCKMITDDIVDRIGVDAIVNNSMFDTKTTWKTTNINVNSNDLIKGGKQTGVNLKKVHERGINGEGTNIAIIDGALLTNHTELEGRVKFYAALSQNKKVASMHGIGMSSIAVGNTVGVAPKANLYYVADDFGHITNASTSVLDELDLTNIAYDINELVEMNKELESKDKIKVISISSGFIPFSNQFVNKTKGSDEMQEAITNAEKNNVVVLCITPDNPISQFNGLEKKPYSNGQSIDDFTIAYDTDNVEDFLYVPMNGITIASDLGVNDYTYTSYGGESSIVPYVAGLYLLACQVDNNITFTKFVEICNETAIESFIDERPIKIVDIKGVINYLQK